MARFLALDWDHQQVHVVSATLRGGRVHIQRAATWKEEQSPNPAEAESLGRLLRERLKDAGIAPAPVLVCIGRDRTILKEVRFPPVSAGEEPAVAHFQVSKELTDSPDDVVIDYTRVAETGTIGEQLALGFVIRRELLATYETLCRVAGLKLLSLTPRPFGILACWRRVAGRTALTPAPEPPDAAVALLTVEERAAEFSIVRGDQLVLSRSLATGNSLAVEIRRNLLVYAGQSPQQPVRVIYVAGGDEHAPFRERLHEALGIPVYAMDPFAGVELPELPSANRGGFAGSAGLLYGYAERRELPINFTRPKRPRPPRHPAKNRLVAACGLAAALVLGAAFFCYGQLADRKQQQEAMRLQKTQIEGQLVRLEEVAKEITLLDDWNRSGIVWLDELYDLTDRFPDTQTIRLTRLTGDPLTRTAQNKYAAKMTLNGITTEDYHAVNTLIATFVADRHYRVEPPQVSLNSGADRSRFQQQFTTQVDIEKQPPNKYVRRLVLGQDADADAGTSQERRADPRAGNERNRDSRRNRDGGESPERRRR